MRPPRHFRALSAVAVGVALLLATALPGSAASPSPPPVSNLRRAGTSNLWNGYTALEQGRLAFGVVEADNGRTDLNGDGDAADTVVHVWDPATGTTTNLGLAMSAPVGVESMLVTLSGGRLAFGVPEAAQGHDLNGDGDLADTVVHVWDPGTGVTNLKLAVQTVSICCSTDQYRLVALDGGGVAFSVPEAGQGNLDRNGDRDTKDAVVAVWNPVTGAVTNLGLASTGTTLVALRGGGLGMLVGESAQHHGDLNGDGDTKDTVAHVWRPGATPSTTNLKLASKTLLALDGGRLTVLVEEAAQGATDLNGDGDAVDAVTHVWDPARPTPVENLGLAGYRLPLRSMVALDGGRLAFRVLEADQGADLNGDGDRGDKVVHIWDPATDRTTNLRQPGVYLVPVDGGSLAFEAPKGLQVWDAATFTLIDVGYHNNGIAQSLPGGRVAFGVAEFGSPKRDLNGDGDKTDYSVLHIWDPATRKVTNLRLVGEGIALSGGGFAFGVSEPSQGFDANGNGNGDDPGVDLNGDGDGHDSVVFVWDPATGAANNLRIAGNPVAALAGNRVAVLVSEAQQGADLNGDGDAADMVVHIVTAR